MLRPPTQKQVLVEATGGSFFGGLLTEFEAGVH